MTAYRVRAWSWFVGTALLLLAVVSWLTVTLHHLDRDEVQARRQADLQERLRLALWRMDSWLSPQLAREAMRPPTEYRAFAPPGAAWTRGFSRLAADEVLVPSPLLGSESPVFSLHFELGPAGEIESPQVPTGNQRDVAEVNGVDPAVIERAGRRLLALQPLLARTVIEQKLGGAESLLPMMGCNIISPELAPQTQQSVSEYSNRQMNVRQNVGAWTAAPVAKDASPAAEGAVGPMVPFWLDGGAAPCLVFARRVRSQNELEGVTTRVQGVVVDWPQLQQELLQLVQDLFPADCTQIVRCEQPTAPQQATMLASLPARLQAAPVAGLASGLPMVTILGITWGATLLALLVLGFTLRTAIGFGERRARFASAVTHELRTPLTTFRMYSEMLADGMVTEPGAQREYLATLQRESDRLSRVVENVLAWSRLEEGRFASRRERCEVFAMIDRLAPTLQRRLFDAEMQLCVTIDDAAREAVVVTDEDAVGQILFNLVDNAAKYGKGGEAVVELRVGVREGAMHCTVRDHGPGVPAAFRHRIFAPFDRGAVPTASNDAPGVGLGLALARGLARDLGGELRLDDSVHDGASFVLELPRA
ncbi:MAG TPA: HAMP domain-containing sensor histidine kinase [Planctomycetota bacterium]|nr:HAMP domain-containing sensor histidine kinase [Planctomycetota bacterium]